MIGFDYFKLNQMIASLLGGEYFKHVTIRTDTNLVYVFAYNPDTGAARMLMFRQGDYMMKSTVTVIRKDETTYTLYKRLVDDIDKRQWRATGL